MADAELEADVELEIRSFKSGDIVFKQGKTGDEAYIVKEGMVEITKETDQGAAMVLNTLKQSKMFGEMALIDSSPRMATARAIEPTTVIVIPKSALERLLTKTDVVIRIILNTVMDRLRNQTDRYVNNAS